MKAERAKRKGKMRIRWERRRRSFGRKEEAGGLGTTCIVIPRFNILFMMYEISLGSFVL